MTDKQILVELLAMMIFSSSGDGSMRWIDLDEKSRADWRAYVRRTKPQHLMTGLEKSEMDL